MRVASKKHDVIGIQVYDEKDERLPAVGLLQIEDAETGETTWLDTKDTMVQHFYKQQFQKIRQDAKNIFRTAGADLVQIATGEDYVKALQQFFIKRA